MSPLSSSVSQTAATCETLKFSVGSANIGCGISGKPTLAAAAAAAAAPPPPPPPPPPVAPLKLSAIISTTLLHSSSPIKTEQKKITLNSAWAQDPESGIVGGWGGRDVSKGDVCMRRPVRCVWPARLGVSQPKEEEDDDDPISNRRVVGWARLFHWGGRSLSPLFTLQQLMVAKIRCHNPQAFFPLYPACPPACPLWAEPSLMMIYFHVLFYFSLLAAVLLHTAYRWRRLFSSDPEPTPPI